MLKKILVIEDHPFQRVVLLTLLEQFENISVTSVGCANDALVHLGNERPDMIICDLNMPMVDGITLLRLLAESGYDGEVVISSAVEKMVLKAAARMCEAYNMNLRGSISKPMTHSKLASVLLQSDKPKKNISVVEPTISDEDIMMGFKRKEFIAYYQPIVQLPTGQWSDCEALVRWQHPQYGLLSPIWFLERITQLGLTSELSKLMLDNVIKELPKLCGTLVSVNISAQDLMNEEFVESVIELARKKPSLSKRIRFELTESEVIEHLGYTLSSAVRLCLVGFSFSVDDFGTGYSSFKLLDDMPFDKIKIDQSFIKNMLQSGTALSIVETSLFLAKKLNMQTVSEGIESKAEWDKLRQLCGGFGQGYFIARPMPVDQLAEWHAGWRVRMMTEKLVVDLHQPWI
ncbi:MAG TPA: diguanylate phosphodiesterase [Vibrio sp.]|nr:diguanylate phosphodiesterase [Vibrio sp.]